MGSVYTRKVFYWVQWSVVIAVVLIFASICVMVIFSEQIMLFEKLILFAFALLISWALLVTVPKLVKKIEIKERTVHLELLFGQHLMLKDIESMTTTAYPELFYGTKLFYGIVVKHRHGKAIIDQVYWFKSAERLLRELEEEAKIKIIYGPTGQPLLQNK